MTAKTLGLDARYDIVFRVLAEIGDSSGDAMNFEEFLKSLTARIVPFDLMLGKPGDEPADHDKQPAQEDQGHGAPHQLNQIHSGTQNKLR